MYLVNIPSLYRIGRFPCWTSLFVSCHLFRNTFSTQMFLRSLPMLSCFIMLSCPTQILVDVMRKRSVKAGEWVIRQGDRGDCFFIIDKGTFEVRVNPDSNAVVTDEKDAGELALASRLRCLGSFLFPVQPPQALHAKFHVRYGHAGLVYPR